MPRFRTKPVIKEAWQFDGTEESAKSLQARFPGIKIMLPIDFIPPDGEDIEPSVIKLTIPTLEGPHWANPGDWIIQGLKGEIYPCKPDIFEKTYEPAE